MFKLKHKINLELTQKSGQTSQPPWKCGNENVYSELLFLDNNPVLVKIYQNDLNSINFNYELFHDCNISNKDVKNKIIKIFNLDFDLESFYKFLTNDEKLAPSIEFCNGLRLFIAKNPFECIISSICSANNSISRWTNSINDIKRKWGNSYNFNGETFYDFPQIATFYENSISNNTDLKSCGVGYRDSYMEKSSKLLLNDIDIESIATMKYDEAFQTILKLPGVGPKVADCILLYGYGFMEAFPSDVWIKRIISTLYFDGEDISASKVRDFGMGYFKSNAGYAQLYLFHYARKSGLINKLKVKK